MNNLFSKAKKLINDAHHIALSTHAEPDLDGLGSLLALTAVLRQLGKNAQAFSLDPMPKIFQGWPTPEIVNNLNPAKIDLIIGLDYGTPERLEILNVYPTIKAAALSFDHHAVGRHLGLKIVDGNISSTAEIVYNFIHFLEAPIDNIIATYLLAGIMDDTGKFRHNSTSAQTLKIAGELMLKGASLQKVNRTASALKLDEKLAALADVFDKIKISTRVPLVFTVIDYAAFSQASNGFNEIGAAEILSSSPEAKLALTITEKTPGFFDVSLRAQSDRGVDVARLATAFGGGGHRLAAGFRSDKSPKEIIAKIEKLLLAAAELNSTATELND